MTPSDGSRGPNDFESWSPARRQAHWAECVAFSYLLRYERKHDKYLDLARAMMRRARKNVETIVGSLRAAGYRFVSAQAAHVPPSTDLADRVKEFESHGLHVPLSLLAWWQEVGSVNLIGSHPDWPFTGYMFKGDRRHVWYTDPLYVAGPETLAEYENWVETRDEHGKDYLRYIGPYRIEIARRNTARCDDGIALRH